jgi:hypothetical protein
MPHLFHFSHQFILFQETDVDLPRSRHGKIGKFKSSSLSIDTEMLPSNFAVIPQISPVLDPSIYEELSFCDCSLFPECALGKGIPLLDLDERRREIKRATDLLDSDIIPDPPMPKTFAQRHHQRPPSFKSTKMEMGRKIERQNAFMEENGGGIGIGRQNMKNFGIHQGHYYHPNWNSSSSPPPPPPDHLSPSRSPTSSSNSSSSSAADHFDDGEKAILFRLPLTITRAKNGLGECEVRERRVDGRKGQTESVDFTEMGLFVAPPSETDPEEAFVIVERRKLMLANLG